MGCTIWRAQEITYWLRQTSSCAHNVNCAKRCVGGLESSVELSPVGDIGLLEDCFGRIGVFVQGFRIRAESQIRDNDVTSCFEKAKCEGKGDTATTAGDEGGLAIEIVKRHGKSLRML